MTTDTIDPVAQFARDHEHADELFLRASEGERLTVSERAWLRSLGSSDSDTDREIRKLGRIRDLQQLAGSSADRADAIDAHSRAVAVCDKRTPKLAALEASLPSMEVEFEEACRGLEDL